MGRDRGRGKGGGRGGRGTGKKMYIDNVEELEKRNRQDHDDEDEEEEEEEEGTKGPGETVFGFQRAAKPAAGTDGDDAAQMMGSLSINNPNRAVGADGTAEVGMNRKEREALAAAKAREDYLRRHMAGETEQAKKELARLAEVRARREAAAKKREEEGRAPGWTQSGIESSSDSDDSGDDEEPKEKSAPAPKVVPPSIAKKKAAVEAEEAAAAASADGGPPKLNAMDIKKMNGDALKDHLKERGLSTQGQKKDLMKRLVDYEAARP